MSDAELEAARPDEVETQLAAHEAWTERLVAAPDPGVGLPRQEAERAREAQLRQLEAHSGEVERLRAAHEATSPEKAREAAMWERARYFGRRKAAREATSPEDQAHLDRMHEELRARERDRKARERLAALRQRRRNPAHPDALELVGAVMMEEALFEATEVKLRDDGKGTFTNTHNLEPLEIGVLVTCLHLLRERGSVEVTGMGSSARWPRREPTLVPVDGLRDALLQLRRQGWLAFRVEGNVASVWYGERAVEVAERWGISLREVGA